MTGRYIPNAFNVTPTEVYRIYTDGRADELVRGVTWLERLYLFSQILKQQAMIMAFLPDFAGQNRWCPVSTVCPTVFVKQ